MGIRLRENIDYIRFIILLKIAEKENTIVNMRFCLMKLLRK